MNSSPAPPPGAFDEVAWELYGVALGEFTAARGARARAAREAGDRDLAARIAALRKPTQAAWALNHLVRERPRELRAFLGLGEALRGAQATGTRLRELVVQRGRVVSVLAHQAQILAGAVGVRLSAQTVGEVIDTLEAALADEDAAALLSAGRLTTPLPAPTTLPTGPAPEHPVQTPPCEQPQRATGPSRTAAAHERAIAQAQARVREAEDAERAAGKREEEQHAQAQAAARRAQEADNVVRELERQLDEARRLRQQTREEADRAEETHQAAHRQAQQAADRTQGQRRHLRTLRKNG